MYLLRPLLLALLLLAAPATFAASVDTLAVPSAAMNRTYRAAVVLPTSYQKNKKARYPVLYLLHGAWGHFDNWLKSTPDKQTVHRLADQYNLIIVCPEGETFGFYLDSPVNPGSQFETHIIKEVLPLVDKTYRTVADKKGRVIAGLSMGGHGALYLSARHPGLFAAAGSMSGALDLRSLTRNVSEAEKANREKLWAPVLGSETEHPERFAANSVMSLLPQIDQNKLPIIIDCGVDDFLIEINRELHRRLVYNHVPHDYTERPGAHTWDYWQNALPYQVLFLTNVLKANGTTVER